MDAYMMIQIWWKNKTH